VCREVLERGAPAPLSGAKAELAFRTPRRFARKNAAGVPRGLGARRASAAFGGKSGAGVPHSTTLRVQEGGWCAERFWSAARQRRL